MVRYLFNTRVTGHDWEVTNGMRGQGEEGESITPHRIRTLERNSQKAEEENL